MTEAQNGVMTSRELGMAVADKLRQTEERPKGRDTEQPPKPQNTTRRALMPPQTSDEREKRRSALIDDALSRVEEVPKYERGHAPGDGREDPFRDEYIAERARQQGKNPRALTIDEQKELYFHGRFLTPEERKERAEIEAEIRAPYLTEEGRRNKAIDDYYARQVLRVRKRREETERELEAEKRGEIKEPDTAAQEAADRALFTADEWRAIKEAPELNQIIEDFIIGPRREQARRRRYFFEEDVDYRAAKLGLDYRTLSAEQKEELYTYRRFLTDEERKFHAERTPPTVEQKVKMYKTWLDLAGGGNKALLSEVPAFDRLPPAVKSDLFKQWYETHVLQDSQKFEQMTFWEVIGELVSSLLASAGNYLKDTPADKK